jgi:hypothetical protein
MPRAAEAARQHFEPTDLELEDTGILDVDLQFGFVRGPSNYRVVAPDVEIDLGLAKNVELDLDLAYGVATSGVGVFKLDRGVTDNLWVSSKVGLWSTRDDAEKTSWGLGMQMGPKLALGGDAHGVGYEGLLLLARNMGRTHLVLNLGGFVDPGVTFDTKRPVALEAGLDLTQDLDRDGMFSILGEIGGIHYFSADPDQFQLTYGLQFEPVSDLDLSLVGLLGAPPGGDHYGVLFGLSPKFALWQ